MKKHRGTVLVGLVDKDSIWLGADDMVIGENDYMMGQNKFYERKDAGTGKIHWMAVSAGSIRSAQLFEKCAGDWVLESESDIRDLANDILQAHIQFGMGKSEDGELPIIDAEFLLATPFGLYAIYDDLCYIKYDKFVTGGIGNEYAKSFIQLRYGKESSKSLITNAIRVAGELSPYCSSNADVREFKLPKVSK